MKLRYYTAFTLLFVIALGWYVHGIAPNHFALSISTSIFDLPIALWIVGIVLLFFGFTLLFVLGGSLMNLFARYNERRDMEKLVRQIMDQDTKNTFIKASYHNSLFGTLSKILARFKLQADPNTPESGYEKLDRLFTYYQDINEEHAVDLHKYDFSPQNPFYIHNLHNQIRQDLKRAHEVLKSDAFSTEIKQHALIAIIERGSNKELPKVLKNAEKLIDREVLAHLLEAYLRGKTTLNQETIARLCTLVGYESQDYLQLAKKTKILLAPDARFKFFEFLATQDERAERGLLYILLDLEMIDQVRERLSTHPKDEFMIINAYLDLKMMDKSYPLEVFFGV
ncbi:hypothetical protein ACFOPX_07075 [Helicobacter baculiformis]|uniref:LapA family protein n=1 Tax=Helicobacter baculiformis TaxID=427351 RepID=A0ABV7ZIA4_9HELI|nr:hypothetical protein [Helicobacter baculiformis]